VERDTGTDEPAGYDLEKVDMDDLGGQAVALAGLDEGADPLSVDIDPEDGAFGNAGGHFQEFLLVEEDVGGGITAAINDRGNPPLRAELVEFALCCLRARE